MSASQHTIGPSGVLRHCENDLNHDFKYGLSQVSNIVAHVSSSLSLKNTIYSVPYLLITDCDECGIVISQKSWITCCLKSASKVWSAWNKNMRQCIRNHFCNSRKTTHEVIADVHCYAVFFTPSSEEMISFFFFHHLWSIRPINELQRCPSHVWSQVIYPSLPSSRKRVFLYTKQIRGLMTPPLRCNKLRYNDA